MNLTFFIAKRLYGSRTDKSVSRPAIYIATLGVAIGLAVMLLSMAIVSGFKGEIKSKLIGFGSDIQVSNIDRNRGYESNPIQANDSLLQRLTANPAVKHVQRYANKPAVLKTDEQFRGIGLKGIGGDYDTQFLKRHLVDGVMPVFSDTVVSNQIVISNLIAKEMQLKVGDKVYGYLMDEHIRARRFQVAAIFETHLTEFDKNLVFTDLYAVQKLNSWRNDQVTGIEIQLTDYNQLLSVYSQIAGDLNEQVDSDGNTYLAATIEMLYPSLFSWLSLLDMNVWVILALMLAVAGFSMISGLLILILERTNMIGILKALGASNFFIRQVFLNFAVLLVGRGMLLGNILGLGVCWLQMRFGLFHLDPDTYYVDVVPVQLNLGWIVAFNIGTLLISVLVLLGPSYMISRIHPAKAIRFE